MGRGRPENRVYTLPAMMSANAIFVPMSVLALWTGVVVLLTGFRRVWAVRQGRIPAGAFKLGESAEVPDDVAVVNRNLMNLLEMPLLFYVVCLCLYVTHQAYRLPVALAWTYVALRIAHSLVHLTANRIRHRLVFFAASNVVLMTIWIRFLARLL